MSAESGNSVPIHILSPFWNFWGLPWVIQIPLVPIMENFKLHELSSFFYHKTQLDILRIIYAKQQLQWLNIRQFYWDFKYFGRETRTCILMRSDQFICKEKPVNQVLQDSLVQFDYMLSKPAYRGTSGILKNSREGNIDELLECSGDLQKLNVWTKARAVQTVPALLLQTQRQTHFELRVQIRVQSGQPSQQVVTCLA